MAEVQTPEGYAEALGTFDATICEALAVNQGAAQRSMLAHVGYATYIFARMCAHGVSMVRAAPRSRWVQSDSEDWSFCCVAPHARALLEGYRFFVYLMEEPSGEEEARARVNVLQLNDCTKRLELMVSLDDPVHIARFTQRQQKLKERLQANSYFKKMLPKAQTEILKGKKPWLMDQDQLLALAGFNKQEYDALWLFYSQHCHVLPLSFYTMESDGRGSGLENDADRGYIGQALMVGASMLAAATNKMVFRFPDTHVLRKGLASKFGPGPEANLPILQETTSLTELPVEMPHSDLGRNIRSFLNVMKRSAQ